MQYRQQQHYIDTGNGSGSASDSYRRVLALDANNSVANEGLDAIASIYLHQAEQKFLAGDTGSTLRDVDNGLQARPGHSALLALKRQAKRKFIADEAYTRARKILKNNKQGIILDSACQQFEIAAQHGHPEAQMDYAICLADGQGIKQDELKAIEILTSLAEAGDVKAQYYVALGHLFSAQAKPKEAYRWAKRAVEQEYRKAYRLLSWIYDSGIGTDRDSSQATKLGFKTLSSAIMDKLGDQTPLGSWEAAFDAVNKEKEITAAKKKESSASR